MVSGVHGVLLGRQAEGVIAHGVQHIVALHTLHAGHDIGGGVTLGMAGMEANAGGVREHIQDIVLGLGKIPYVSVEGLVFFPVFLPFGFNGGMFVNWHNKHLSYVIW